MKMKKYLMTGIAALALCVGFTSCSHDLEQLSQEEIDQLEAKKIVDNYNKAFKAYVGGEIAANQTWGFAPVAGSRTRRENANANEWADPTKAYGGLKVPPPLTPEQTAVVIKYFQTHPNLGYMDPQWTNYFIQQVYKGNPETAGDYSPEQYKSADWTESNQTYILASDKMNHLVAVDEENGIVDHINNFNHGDCSVNNDVLTWSPDYVSVEGQTPTHSDKIMYMKESTTKSFGYYNSEGSLYHTQHTGLVSYEKIIEDMGAEANCLNDGWNRSFMGFDFEQMVGDDVYSKNIEYDYSGGWKEEYNTTGWPIKSITYNTWRFDADGDGVEEEYKFLSANKNMYAADRTEKTFSTEGGVAKFNSELPTDAQKRQLLSLGYLPDTDSFREWVKVGGTADGYYSDWIVTLTEANTSTTPPGPTPQTFEIRVMAEDLSAKENSDFDFNDVVFDVTYTTGQPTATITLQAAGGTLPLRVNSTDGVGGFEVHDKFGGYPTTTMINTGWSGSNGANNVAPATETIEFSATDLDTFLAAVKAIRIEVYKTLSTGTTDWFEMEAEQGKPAAKFAVPTTVTWMDERQSIKNKYGKFCEWATSAPNVQWWDPSKADDQEE